MFFLSQPPVSPTLYPRINVALLHAKNLGTNFDSSVWTAVYQQVEEKGSEAYFLICVCNDDKVLVQNS